MFKFQSLSNGIQLFSSKLLPLSRIVSPKIQVTSGTRFFGTNFYSKNSRTDLEFHTQKYFIESDIKLYEYQNKRFFQILQAFGLGQFVFWTILSYSALKMKETTINKDEFKSRYMKFLAYFDFSQHKKTFSALMLILGLGTLVFSSLFVRRSVSSITLKKGGKDVLISVCNPFGRDQPKLIKLDKISANNSRQDSKNMIILKIKNKWFHYLVDMEGNFYNKNLFDITVGLKR